MNETSRQEEYGLHMCANTFIVLERTNSRLPQPSPALKEDM